MPRPLSELKLNEDKDLRFQVALAKVVRERRMFLRLSQEEVADTVLTQSHISMIELGKREIGMNTFIRLARRLQLEPGRMMDEVMERVVK